MVHNVDAQLLYIGGKNFLIIVLKKANRLYVKKCSCLIDLESINPLFDLPLSEYRVSKDRYDLI